MGAFIKSAMSKKKPEEALCKARDKKTIHYAKAHICFSM